MLLGGDVLVCIAYSETDNEVENIVKDALDNDKVGCTWPGHLFFMSQCGAACGFPDCSQAVAGGSDEVGKTVDSHCGKQ